jgi:hypothetical protein
LWGRRRSRRGQTSEPHDAEHEQLLDGEGRRRLVGIIPGSVLEGGFGVVGQQGLVAQNERVVMSEYYYYVSIY